MELSIIILHHNTPKAVSRLLSSLKEAVLPNQTEILVLDNGGKNANEQLKEHATILPIKWFSIANRGFAAGQNEGLKQSLGTYVAVLNPDIQLATDCIDHLLQHIKLEPECGIATAQLQYPSGEIQDNTRTFPRLGEFMVRRLVPAAYAPKPDYDDIGQAYKAVDWCSGALWMMRRADIKKIGGHRENYFLFMSDIALCRDMWEHKKRIDIVFTATATHEAKRLSSGNAFKMLFKKTGRIHIADACKYFWHYRNKSIPALSPSALAKTP